MAVLVMSSVFRSMTPILRVACFILLSSLAYSSARMMEMTCSSETSVHFKQATRNDVTSEKIELSLVDLREYRMRHKSVNRI
jgi:hypothetical protein